MNIYAGLTFESIREISLGVHLMLSIAKNQAFTLQLSAFYVYQVAVNHNSPAVQFFLNLHEKEQNIFHFLHSILIFKK